MDELDCINIKKSLRFGVDGFAHHCCLQNQALKDEKGNAINCRHNTFEEAMYSKTSLELRESFKKGIKHPLCKTCWDEEKRGMISKRMRDNRHYKEQNINYNKIEIIFLDISLGNLCNLKCRSCNKLSSILWLNDQDIVPFKLRLFRDLPDSYQDRIDKAYNEDSLFWEECKKNISTIKWIDFYGGEPFLVKKQWEFLKYIISENIAKDIILHYNTNGTIWDQDKWEILKEFKLVIIDFSVDGINEKARYIRHPSNWNKISKNFKTISNLTKDNPKVIMNICLTVSILSLYYMEETLQFFDVMQHHNLFINMLHGPSYYNIKNIPTKIKNKILEDIKEPINNIVKKFNNSNIFFLNTLDIECDMEEWNNFLEITKVLDEHRGESFSKTFPEFAEIIRNEGYDI